MTGRHPFRMAVGVAMFGVLLSGGCASGEHIRVTSAVGPGVRFDAKTDAYDWLPAGAATRENMWAEVPSVHQVFRQTVENELNARGYHYQPGSPNAVKLDDRLVRRTVSNATNPGVDRRIDTITLYVRDAESGEAIWGSKAEVEFEERAQSADEVRGRVERVVKQMLAPIKNRPGTPRS